MPRGGKRPGAGAKPGNLNALSHGESSLQLVLLAQQLAKLPKVRNLLVKFARRQKQHQKRAERMAFDLLLQFVSTLPENHQSERLLSILMDEPGYQYVKQQMAKLQSNGDTANFSKISETIKNT